MTALIPNPLKPSIKHVPTSTGRCWVLTCPCGFEWHTAHHRLAVILATGHTHRSIK